MERYLSVDVLDYVLTSFFTDAVEFAHRMLSPIILIGVKWIEF